MPTGTSDPRAAVGDDQLWGTGGQRSYEAEERSGGVAELSFLGPVAF